MVIHEVKHPCWGSNLANQIAAHAWQGRGNCGNYNFTERPTGFFGSKETIEKKEYVGSDWAFVTDDNKEAKRQYRHRCSLLAIVMTQHRNGPMFVVFLDGHVTSNFFSNEMEFRFAPDDLKKSNGNPIAEVWFSGKGKRWGPLHDYSLSRIICTFADNEQMEKYLDLTNRRMPKFIVNQGITYNVTSDGHYQSSDGNILPSLLVMYFLLSPSEQLVFVAQNPEVQSLLGDIVQDPPIIDFNKQDLTNSNYGNQFNGLDFGDSNATDGDSDGGDSDGGGDGGGGGD